MVFHSRLHVGPFDLLSKCCQHRSAEDDSGSPRSPCMDLNAVACSPQQGRLESPLFLN